MKLNQEVYKNRLAYASLIDNMSKYLRLDFEQANHNAGGNSNDNKLYDKHGKRLADEMMQIKRLGVIRESFEEEKQNENYKLN